MKEKTLIGLLIGLCVLTIIAGFTIYQEVSPFSPENVEVTNYSLVFHENGTLMEIYRYSISKPDSVWILTRDWNIPLSATPLENKTYVQILGIATPPGSVGFFNDNGGNTTILRGTKEDETVFAGLYRLKNSAGVFNRDKFPGGETTVGYLFRIFPLIEFDDKYAHLNLDISDTHVRFRNINLTFTGANITKVRARPPNLVVKRINGGFEVTGDVLADEELGVDILFNNQVLKSLPGYAIYTPGVYILKDASYPFYNAIPRPLSTLLLYLGIIWLIALPFLFIIIYRRFGKEKPVTVPEFVCLTPDRSLKPWQVNLIFKNDAVDFDEDGFNATLFDLHRRGIITISVKQEGREICIKVQDDHELDSYEEQVVKLIRIFAPGDEFNNKNLNSLVEEASRNKESEKRILQYRSLLEDLNEWTDEDLISQYIFKGRWHITPLILLSVAGFALTVILLLVTPVFVSTLISGMIFWIFALVETIIAYMMPETLFGRWKGDAYREKLEWEAFGHFLSDIKMIRENSPFDPSIWSEWLAYGNAMGIGEKMEEAIRHLDIDLSSDLHILKMIPLIFLSVMDYTPRGAGDIDLRRF